MTDFINFSCFAALKLTESSTFTEVKKQTNKQKILSEEWEKEKVQSILH